MDAIRSKRLARDFPLFLRGRNESLKTNLMGFGFECGPGWYALIRSICEVAEKECRRQRALGLNPEFWPKAVQVKEKFGTLRFYCFGANDAISAAIDRAENLSGQTCETCGKPSSVGQSASGWMSSNCADCRARREAQEAAGATQRAQRKAARERLLAAFCDHCRQPQSHPGWDARRRVATLLQVIASYDTENHDRLFEALSARPIDGARELRSALRLARRYPQRYQSAKYGLNKINERLKPVHLAAAARQVMARNARRATAPA